MAYLAYCICVEGTLGRITPQESQPCTTPIREGDRLVVRDLLIGQGFSWGSGVVRIRCCLPPSLHEDILRPQSTPDELTTKCGDESG